MGRKAAPQPLALSDTAAALGHDDLSNTETTSQGASPAESRSPKSPRSSPFHSRFSPLKSQDRKQQTQAQTQVQQHSQQSMSMQLQLRQEPNQQVQPNPNSSPASHSNSNLNSNLNSNYQSSTRDIHTTYPPISSAFDQPPIPPAKNGTTPVKGQHEAQKASRNGFFHFNKASKPSNHYQPQVHVHQNHSEARTQMMSRGSDSTSRSRYGDPTQSDLSLQKPISADPSRSDVSISSSVDYDTAAPQFSKRDKAKQKPFTKLTRTRSLREEGTSSRDNSAPTNPTGNEPELYLNSVPLRTAPVAQQERSFRGMMNSTARNRSEDRAPVRDLSATRDGLRERESKTQPSSLRENGGSTFLSGLKNSKAADIFSKGLFGKSSRSSSTNERGEPSIDDENYQLRVINLPLVEQTRMTRISKRLEDSRDKTEFWMPAFPWRAIDYLNYKGCEVEGLYRVPGSGPQIKKWQRRFDERFDVNLFEEDDLYDINIIGSMLKAWLRELPDELLPKAAQERVARECAGATQVPQLLIDELSNLSPFNYYLLFAITCHLSLLLAHSDKNKMDFRNLCICFQPCMKIDAFCFKFLVCDWRDCWRGCKNENRYIEEEYRLFEQPPPRGLTEPQKPVRQEPDIDRQQLSSSDSSKHSALGPTEQKLRPRRKPLQLSESNGSMASNNSSISTTLTINSDRSPPPQVSTNLRPLSPITPLSPLGF